MLSLNRRSHDRAEYDFYKLLQERMASMSESIPGDLSEIVKKLSKYAEQGFTPKISRVP
jgi:hypothetical protein